MLIFISYKYLKVSPLYVIQSSRLYVNSAAGLIMLVFHNDWSWYTLYMILVDNNDAIVLYDVIGYLILLSYNN